MEYASKDYDFSGMATVYGQKCSDGRVIAPGAFKKQHNDTVTLVFRHGSKKMNNIVGKATLEHTEKGIRAHCTFNSTKSGQKAKVLVQERNIKSLSIMADDLIQNGSNVIDGTIGEVSLVVVGANKRATIDDVASHENTNDDSEYYTNEDFDPFVRPLILHMSESEDFIINEGFEDSNGEDQINHEGQKQETVADIFKTFNEDQMSMLYSILYEMVSENDKGSDDPRAQKIQDVFTTLNEKQKNAVYYMVGSLQSDTIQQSSSEEDSIMTDNMHNPFDRTKTFDQPRKILTHEQQSQILTTVKATQSKSLKGYLVEHAAEYGIDNITNLYPDHTLINPGGMPYVVSTPAEWVTKFMSKVDKVPFTRIKATYVDRTDAEIAARGHVKGDTKLDVVLMALTRLTQGQMVYVRTMLDREDKIEITDFDILAFLKMNLQKIWVETVCRAALIGDGRALLAVGKIAEDKIRPVWTDDNLYRILTTFDIADTILNKIDKISIARADYRGSGDLTMYASPAFISSMMVVRDDNGRRIHDTMESLKAALRVNDIVEVPVMAGKTRVDTTTRNLEAIILDPKDYTFGMPRVNVGGFFEDFDLLLNQDIVLYEQYLSGALTKPASAMVFETDTEVDPTP